MRVVHLASEAVPVAKTGGLADVVGSLPAAQAAAGHRTAVILPCHRLPTSDLTGFEPMGRTIEVGAFRFGVLRRVIDGVDFLLLDAPRLFERPGLYGTPDGDFPDNAIRFAAFSRAAVRAAAAELGETDVFHCHDWQTALVPLLLGTDPFLGGDGTKTPTVLTIHNLAYQGSFEPWVVDAAHLPPHLFTPRGFEFFGTVNYLKGGILGANALTTVSPTYAREILTPGHGCGLHQVLGSRRHLLQGILNGLDTRSWNPVTDSHLPKTYTARDVSAGKRACRRELARELGLDDDGSPLAGVVARLVHQKGADLLVETTGRLTGLGARLVVLGSGDPAYQEALTDLARRRPGRIAVETGFNEPLAHRIYAAADLFLMPSRFEPCGLGQLIALRYGALPIVNPVGGLADTIRDLSSDPGGGNGFWMRECTAAGLLEAVGRALATIGNPGRLLRLRRRIMAEDHGWSASVPRYDEVYRTIGPHSS